MVVVGGLDLRIVASVVAKILGGAIGAGVKVEPALAEKPLSI